MARRKFTKEEFQREFAEIRNKRFKSVIKGTGGAGNTLEHILRLGVDNKQKGDLGFAELKVRTKGATSSVKLFSLDREAWQMTQSEATQKWGTQNDEGKKRLFFEFRNGTITKTGLRLFGEDESVSILSPNNDVIAKWTLDALVEVFTDKLNKIVIVTAENFVGRDGKIEHAYRTALYLHGFSKDKIRAAFLNNIITLNLHIESIDIRPDGSWKVKNRGTAFRAQEDELENLFDNKEFL